MYQAIEETICVENSAMCDGFFHRGMTKRVTAQGRLGLGRMVGLMGGERRRCFG